jgi:regulator of sigma E protease
MNFTSIFAFGFVLGVLIFVHELGHFLMARRIGVRVLTFSLGFGPKLLAFRRGDTEYCISAIPLGGYVKMAGENPDDARTGADDEFLSKSKWQRFQVLVMGPIMNLGLAVIVMAVVLYQGAQAPAYEQEPVIVGSVLEESVAAASDIRPGDHILAINAEPVETWEEFLLTVTTRAGKRLTVSLTRDGQRLQRELTPRAVGKFGAGDVGVLPVTHPQITAVNDGEPADESGLEAGDVILAAAGERDVSQERVIELIKASENKPLPLQIRRGTEEKSVTVTPRPTDGIVRIGATISKLELRKIEPGPTEAVTLSLERNWEWTKLIVTTLVGLFTRETSVKQLMGPVAIADLSGSAAEAGWIPLFSLMAMISLNLGLLNLMPVPVLDGGHIAILAVEGVSRRDFSMKVKEKMLLAGFVLLVMLMVTVIYNDLMRIQWFENLVPWRRG